MPASQTRSNERPRKLQGYAMRLSRLDLRFDWVFEGSATLGCRTQFPAAGVSVTAASSGIAGSLCFCEPRRERELYGVVLRRSAQDHGWERRALGISGASQSRGVGRERQ